MQPNSNPSVCLYRTTKIQKFENIEDITVARLKVRPTLGQSETFTYNVAKGITNCL